MLQEVSSHGDSDSEGTLRRGWSQLNVHSTSPSRDVIKHSLQKNKWLPLLGAGSQQFSVYVIPSEATPILFGLDVVREFGLGIDFLLSHSYSTRHQVRIPLTVMPCRHSLLSRCCRRVTRQPPKPVVFATEANESQSK